MSDQGEIRDRIIDASVAATIVEAATARIIRYGFGKTSMADIASDCDMSPGNLYRYFVNKMGIAEAVSQRAHEAIFLAIREAVSTLGMTAVERLEAFCLASLRATYHQLDQDPHMVEFAHMLNNKRPGQDLGARATLRDVLAEILDQGVENGEFGTTDVPAAALAIQAATYKYWYPQTHESRPLELLERELRGVLAIIFGGLLSREGHR
jgi:AcrR family transcriptional regulator